MTKLLSNKTFKRFLGIALAILLVVTLMPHIQPAYGDGEVTATNESTTFTEELSDTSVEANEPQAADSDQADTDVVEAPSASSGSPDAAEAVDREALEAIASASVGEGDAEGIERPVAQGTVNAMRYMLAARNISTRTISAGIEEEGMLSYSDGGTYELVVNGTFKGHIDVSGGSTLTIKGYGTIVAGDKVGSVIHVNGGNSKLIIDGDRRSDGATLTITGGNGGTKLNDETNFPNYRGGGGILVQRSYRGGEDHNKGTGATLEFRYGKVDGNKAEAGGGIYIDRGCTFIMEDGIISNNETVKTKFTGSVADASSNVTDDVQVISAGEGGGIYVAGGSVFKGYRDSAGNIHADKGSGRSEVWEQATPAEIKAGQIINNKTTTTYDWGGGGIFVESKGVLKLGNSWITNNTAQGLGGGIAGCPHASIGIGKIEDGFALYGNTAKRANWPTNKYLDDLKVSYNGKTYRAGDRWAKADGNMTADKAKDYYCTNVSYVSGYGDRAIAWTGYATGSKKAIEAHTGSAATGTLPRDIVIRKGESAVVPGESLGLTNTKPKDEKVTGRSVTIKGNESSTHGGGIGCNGTILIGDLGTGDQYNGLSLSINKEFKNSDGDAIKLKGGEFTFKLKKGGEELATATNAADGSVTFVVDDETAVKSLLGGANSEKASTLTITEVKKKDGTPIKYAGDVTVALKVRHDVQEISYPNSTVNVTYHTPVITEIKMNGNVYQNGAFTMVNTVQLKETVEYDPVGFQATKSLVSSLGDKLELKDRSYTFKITGVDKGPNDKGVYEATGTVTAGTDKDGNVAFDEIRIASFLQDQPTTYWDGNTEVEITLTLREVVPEDKGNVTYDEEDHVLTFTVKPTAERTEVDNMAGKKTTTVTPHVVKGSLKLDGDPIAEKPIVNTLNVSGQWQPTATKHYYGAIGEDTAFSFTLKDVGKTLDPARVNLRELLAGEGTETHGVANDFDETGQAAVAFDPITYAKDVPHWYLMTEDGGQDPTVYAFEVQVNKSEDKESLVSTVKNVYYAASADATALTLLENPEAIDFYNADSSMDFGLYSYSVNAMSDEPMDQQCLVDPKVIKQLDGRTIKADEFRFKLIQVMEKDDWANTSGPEISATTNDEFGMVDFDKANNLAAEGLDPCCLLFTAPGTYQYRVIEDADYKKDPSVTYSDQVITFTAVIELQDAEGRNVQTDENAGPGVQLVCTDMFYGYLNDEGQNVRYKDQYVDADTKGEDWEPSAADFPQLNMDWHPTIVNTAKPMDLKVRKTSVLDRAEGLEGATYGLFMVSGDGQGDVFLASATSDAEGWIYYEDVSLSAGNLYYFKEQAAPAGHTVSEFRSPYFYVETSVDPATNITSYVMKYTDTKLALADAVEPLSAEASIEPLTDTDGATADPAVEGAGAD
ncbi:MAG: FctA domain-containing protein, partial [Adlercreutzia sp.]|nr:FctA domain-containing protein [Adlercreutzia sp.]